MNRSAFARMNKKNCMVLNLEAYILTRSVSEEHASLTRRASVEQPFQAAIFCLRGDSALSLLSRIVGTTPNIRKVANDTPNMCNSVATQIRQSSHALRYCTK